METAVFKADNFSWRGNGTWMPNSSVKSLLAHVGPEPVGRGRLSQALCWVLGEESIKVHVKTVPVPLAATCLNCSSVFHVYVLVWMLFLLLLSIHCPLWPSPLAHPQASAQAPFSAPLLSLLLGPFFFLDSSPSDTSHRNNFFPVLSFAIFSWTLSADGGGSDGVGLVMVLLWPVAPWWYGSLGWRGRQTTLGFHYLRCTLNVEPGWIAKTHFWMLPCSIWARGH